MDVILKTHELTKSFGAATAVDHMNMTINRGDIYGFIGKNGAGKTTAMRMVVGTTFPTSGSLELFGGMPLNAARRKIGSLLETPGLYRGCTAKENMIRFSILFGGDEKKINELLELVGLGDTGKKKVGEFSLGMKQRLGIAVALLGDPEFMVLDEPINGLDPEGIKSIRDLVLMLNRERGMTFMISSHLLDELAKIVTRYGIISGGKLVEEIDSQELISRTFDGLRITVDDAQKAINVLSKRFSPELLQADGNVVMLKDESADAASINVELIKSDVIVSEIQHHSGGLEEYFIERMGK